MTAFIEKLLSSDFMPHGMCYLWQPDIIWLHVVSDSLIALSYFVIPLALVHFVRKRRDLPFHWMFLMFGAFIVGCGATHVMEVWTVWNGTYYLAGVVKALTAVASMATAALLVPLIPRALALPSPAQLRAANEDLEREVAERRRAEAALQAARDELEQRVQRRTAELARANEELKAEIRHAEKADEERRRAEQDLKKIQDDLAHVARVTTMGELAASIAHEVNQPLTAVITNANACLRWMAMDPPNLTEARESVTRIRRDGRRASDVVQRIRAFLKRRAPESAPQDVSDVIREVLGLLQDALRAAHVSADVELGKDVPAVLGDRVQIQQVILNLVMNGIDAMRGIQDRPRRLVVGAGPEGGDVVITVRDSGVGIDPDKVDRLFDPFFTTKAEGMGMGLSVSRSIIESHGGRLWAALEGATGATFRFTLPMAQPS
jgi:C4-dicarboxylate-specific signal transduction histidine kinase